MANQQDYVPHTFLALSADPAIEPAGSVYYNSTTGTLHKSDGIVWTEAATASTQRTFAFFMG